MKVSKVIHKSEWRIRVDFSYNQEMMSRLKSIDDAKWSKTMGAWHIPYTKEAFDKLKSLFPDVEFKTGERRVEKKRETIEVIEVKKDTDATTKVVNTLLIKKKATTQQSYEKPVLKKKNEKTTERNVNDKGTEIDITITSKTIYIKLPKNEADIQFLKSFRYFGWKKGLNCWTIPNYNKNIELLTSYFSDRNISISEKEAENKTGINKPEQPAFTKNDLLAVNVSNRVLRVYFGYNHEIMQKVKQIPMSRWNAEKYCWEMPYSDRFTTELRTIADNFKLTFLYCEEEKPRVKPQKSKFDIKNYRECPTEYKNKLIELRYSKNTFEVYTQMFEEFINYYEDYALEDINETMINDYQLYLVNERCVSSSTQNQAINAIKFYYERVMGGKRTICKNRV